MRGKRYKLTLRDLGLTGYFQEVSRGHSKLGYEPGKTRRAHEQTKDRRLELGRIVANSVQRKRSKGRNT